jgi:5-bromo-4-chloroindolyl phosphate hydrolysis protein
MRKTIDIPHWVRGLRGLALAAFLLTVLTELARLPLIGAALIAGLAGLSVFGQRRSRDRLRLRQKPRSSFIDHFLQGAITAGIVGVCIATFTGLPILFAVTLGFLIFVNIAFSNSALTDMLSAADARKRETAKAAAAAPPPAPTPEVAKAPLDPVVRHVLDGAAPDIERLEGARAKIRTSGVSRQLERLTMLVRAAATELESRPDRVGASHRLFTYYLPRAAEIAETYARLEAAPIPDPERLLSIETTLGAMETAFRHFSDEVVAEDMRVLDIDLKALNDAINEDLGKR